jgi:branched-chain amino acid transport system ATP-binding protein
MPVDPQSSVLAFVPVAILLKIPSREGEEGFSLQGWVLPVRNNPPYTPPAEGNHFHPSWCCLGSMEGSSRIKAGSRILLLTVTQLQSGYNHLQVLWDVSLKVLKGEMVALLGRNGSGKTTTLRTIAGLLKPKAGQIDFMDRRIDGLRPHEVSRMRISFIPENLHLFPSMSVLENLLLGAYIIHDPRRIHENLALVYDIFPALAQRRKQLAGSLSGGEQRMLALGRGLMSQPELLLVDEPSLGLAPRMASTVFDTLSKLKRSGLTILLVEQNVHTTLQISDRSYVLDQGRIVMEGESKEFMKNDHVCKTYLGSGDE